MITGSIRVGPLSLVPALLTESGIDPAPILAVAGLGTDVLSDPDHVASYAALDRLLALAARASGSEHFGFQIGFRGGAGSIGLIAYASTSSSSVGAALGYIVEHFEQHDRGAVATLTLQGGAATLGYTVLLNQIEAGDHIADMAMAIACSIMRLLCGPEWAPQEVLLPRRRHQDPSPLRKFFRAPIVYNAAIAGLVFPEATLSAPTIDRDPELARQLRRVVQDRGRVSSFSGLVRHAVRQQLALGEPSADGVAQLFNMHRRTLHRRLQAEGLDFRVILDDVRFAIARNCLRDTDLRISEIALSLGYSEESAFIRAFRKWAGLPPGEWRQVHLRQARADAMDGRATVGPA